ncbi:MAG: hypothetical protein ABI771_16170 [Betaproteobacteria bacterium]
MGNLKYFVIDTLGATAPEFIAAALAQHPQVSVLPGLAFVRDDVRLYRPHRLQDLSALEVFDRLWSPSYEPSGRMWAGIGRRIPRQDVAVLEQARQHFAQSWRPASSYVETLFHFAEQVAPAVGAWKAGGSHLGFCGAPFLKTIDWDELIAHDVQVISSETSLPIWLALVSYRSIVNGLDALKYWIVHKLLRASASRAGVKVQVVDAVATAKRATDAAFSALGLAAAAAPDDAPGLGHALFDATLFAQTEALAADLARLYQGDPLYDAASDADKWVDAVAAIPEVQSLLRHYVTQWKTTAHIHFDTVGPLENEIVTVALRHAGIADRDDMRSFEERFSQAFFHEHIRFRSYSFESPTIDLDIWLGSLERLVTLPHAPYFVHATLKYLERCLDNQGKWFDSYSPLSDSPLYQLLRGPDFAHTLAGHDFAARLERIEQRDAEIAARARERAVKPGSGA